MTQRRFWSGVLIAVLALSVAQPAQAAQSFNTRADEIVIGIVVVAAVIGVVATVLILHYSKSATITGCVKSDTNGMSVTNQKRPTKLRAVWIHDRHQAG
jgi:ABC-type uncharacterized transport system permease subunit